MAVVPFAIGSAVFLVLEMDNQFDGLVLEMDNQFDGILGVSSQPVRRAIV